MSIDKAGKDQEAAQVNFALFPWMFARQEHPPSLEEKVCVLRLPGANGNPGAS
jgi:hypothetical protein